MVLMYGRKHKQTFDFSKLRCNTCRFKTFAALSIGSLGGGNHFIELSQNQDNMDVYLIIHSGSRKLGGDVCKYYQEKAYGNTTLVNKEVQATIDRLKKGRQKKRNRICNQETQITCCRQRFSLSDW